MMRIMKTITDIRYANLLRLTQSVGGTNSKLANFLGKERGFTHAYIRENNPKNIGSAFARFVEEKFKKPHGWMDTEHSIKSPQLLQTLRYIDEELWAYYEVATAQEKMELIDLVFEELSDLELIQVNPNHQLLSKLIKPKLGLT